MHNRFGRLGVAGLALLAGLWAGAAAAQTKIDIEPGWGGMIRGGHWNPIFITIAHRDPKPAAPANDRSAHLELHAPHDAAFALRIHAGDIVIGPKPRTFMLLAPMNWNTADAAVILRSADGGPELARASLEPADEDDFGGQRYQRLHQAQTKTLIGVSWRGPAMLALEEANLDGSTSDSYRYSRPGIKLGFVPEPLLPQHALGYDALSALVLNKPALGAPGSKPRELAILDWVRAGGRLLLWLDDTDFPTDSPLAAALPCIVGGFESLNISPEDLARIGLPRRYANAKHRILAPKPGMSSHSVLGSSQASVVFGRYGLGQIAVLSIDGGDLPFDAAGSNKPWEFWKPIFERGLELSPFMDSEQTQSQRRAGAASKVMDRLGDVKGVGQFDFTYPAVALLAMMFIVGPVDWFVLRKLGRQPWTWATTSGWIVLITVGALYMGHLVKSGDLHYRTLQLIDQVDGAPAARVDMAMIYAPRSGTYGLEMPDGSWWQPASVETDIYYRRSIAQTTLHAQQNGRGNTLRDMSINVWNLRCVRGDTVRAESSPAIEAEVSRSGNQLRGTIRNLGKHPLTEIRIRTSRGIANVCGSGSTGLIATAATTQPVWQPPNTPAPASIPPGHVATFIAELGTMAETALDASEYTPYYSRDTYRGPLVSVAGDLAMQRTGRIDKLLSGGDYACVYAESEAEPTVKLNEPAAREQHWQVIRALVPLK